MRPGSAVAICLGGCAVLLMALTVWTAAPIDELGGPTLDRGVDSLAPPPPGPGQERAADLPLGEAERSSVEAPEALPHPDRHEITGSLRAVDADGVDAIEMGSVDGRFALEWGAWPELHNREVEVRAGEFRVFAPLDVEFALSDFRIRGRVARCDSPRARASADGRLDLVVRMGRALVLRVHDASNGAALAGIELAGGLPAVRARERLTVEVGASHVLHRDLVSPIDVPPEWIGPASATLWVGAAGYAWERVGVDGFAGGEREVRLRPAGNVRFELERLDPRTRPMLRLYGGPFAPAPGPLFEREVAEASLFFERLPAGHYEARVELGADAESAELLGSAAFEIVAGNETRVTLGLDAVETPETSGPLRGVLHLVDAYRAARPSLALLRIEGSGPSRAALARVEWAAMQPLGPGVYGWDLGSTAPGRYLLEVAPLSYRQVLEVRPGGERDVEVRVPPPDELVIVPFDAATGERIAGAVLTWHALPPEGVAYWTPERVFADPRTRQFELLAPAGEVVLNVTAPGFAPFRGPARVGSTQRAISLPLERPVEVLVRLLDAGTPLPFGPDFQIDGVALGHAGAVQSWALVDSACRLSLSEPGPYRLQLKVPASFVPPEPREVWATRGVESALTIELLRR